MLGLIDPQGCLTGGVLFRFSFFTLSSPALPRLHILLATQIEGGGRGLLWGSLEFDLDPVGFRQCHGSRTRSYGIAQCCALLLWQCDYTGGQKTRSLPGVQDIKST